ncbi:hypothetical protein TSO221_15755 [Azospirillum sp. TSO22-1]|nr:hypothetical protein TSO221_15755 [Azospirillum sp. TSO22-1]
MNAPGDYPFYDDDWVYYYDEGDVAFLAGLTDEQKVALKQKWDALSPEEKQQIRDRWNTLDADERARVRQAWSGLDAEKRQQVVSSMQTRISNGTLRSVTPAAAGPSRFQAGSSGGLGGSGARAQAGSFDRGGFGGGGFGGGRMGGGRMGGRR